MLDLRTLLAQITVICYLRHARLAIHRSAISRD